MILIKDKKIMSRTAFKYVIKKMSNKIKKKSYKKRLKIKCY